MNEKIIVQLIEIIKERKKSSDKNSYVVNLFDEGKVKIAIKLIANNAEFATIKKYLNFYIY